MLRFSGWVVLLMGFGGLGCRSSDSGAESSKRGPVTGSAKVADVRLDPVSGEMDGTISLRIEDSPKELVLAFDEGVDVESAATDGGDIEFAQTDFSPFNLVTFQIDEPGSVFEASLVVKGTLACSKLGEGGDY